MVNGPLREAVAARAAAMSDGAKALLVFPHDKRT